MAGTMVLRLGQSLKRIENVLISLFIRQFPPPGLSLIAIGASDINKNIPVSSFSLKDLIGDGFLWGRPTCRTSIERRLSKKFGWPHHVYKLIRPKKNLLVCNACGHHYEAYHLCPQCYAKVRAETEAMQEAIESELGLSAVEKEVVVLYKGEREVQHQEFWQGKRIIEMKKERPPWFSKNLLERTTAQPSTSGDVKPTELA